jgi:hypothetical protein
LGVGCLRHAHLSEAAGCLNYQWAAFITATQPVGEQIP